MSEPVPDPRDESGPDLIERLRHNSGWRNTDHHCLSSPSLLIEAADELTALRTQVSELRADLEREHSAYEIAFNQAMENGASANRLRNGLEALIAVCDSGQRPGGGSIVPPRIRALLKDPNA